MNGKRALWGGLTVVAGGALAAGLVWRARRIAAAAPEVVPFVDIARYLGKWYEIARYPAPFQPDDCVATTATYSLRKDGSIKVVNACHRGSPEGPERVAFGVAHIADHATNAKLKVTFFWPFAGDYWIVDLDPNYQYAAVSDPARRYLWILSRTPEMESNILQGILHRLRGQGFDTRRLIQRTK